VCFATALDDVEGRGKEVAAKVGELDAAAGGAADGGRWRGKEKKVSHAPDEPFRSSGSTNKAKDPPPPMASPSLGVES